MAETEVNKGITLKELKELVYEYSYDQSELSLDVDKMFDLLIKLDLLKDAGTIKIRKDEE